MVLNGCCFLLQNLGFGHTLSLHSIVVIVFIQGQQIKCNHGLAKAQVICFQGEFCFVWILDMPNQNLYSRHSTKYSTKGMLSLPLFVDVIIKRFSVGDSYLY